MKLLCLILSNLLLVHSFPLLQNQRWSLLSTQPANTRVAVSYTALGLFEWATSKESPTADDASFSKNSYLEDTQAKRYQAETIDTTDTDEKPFLDEFKTGFLTIAFITFLNASISPIWHVVFEGASPPPPLFLNAIVSVVASLGLLVGAPFLDSKVGRGSIALAEVNEEKWSAKSFRGGLELGLWRTLGAICHIYGMSLTTANHGAFLLQMTTLIVPVLQGLRGAEKIPTKVKIAIALALAGIVAFTQDPEGIAQARGMDPARIHMGDALMISAAFLYSLYDIQTFYWGREVQRIELVTIKVGFQTLLSCVLCFLLSQHETMHYLMNNPNWQVLIPTVLWSGLIANALATFLQVGGMQAVGPTRAQTIFASQPLWASMMNFVFLGETMGAQGFVGGGAFLGALILAATAEAPVPQVRSNGDSSNESDMLLP